MKEEFNKAEATRQYVSFSLESEEFAIEISRVQEIIRQESITKVPNAPEYVVGIINLRERIIPVIDMRARMGLPPATASDSLVVIIAEVNNRSIGFIVDSVNQVIQLPAAITPPPPGIFQGNKQDLIMGIAKLQDSLLFLVDIQKVLLLEEQQELGELATN
ncbi:MAG: chemotaxis protein CheW [Ignavibacteria bacterium]|nr:chemotaxis protein CheW [Ignavibacteria bacterium]